MPRKPKTKEPKPKMITLGTVKGMGFTPKMIEQLLPEPKLCDNPHYSKAAPMKLWSEEIVLKAMQTEEFKTLSEEHKKRKAHAQKAVETKKAKTKEFTQDLISKITVTVLDDATLRRLTLKEKQSWYDYQASWRDRDYANNAYTADEVTVTRWIVNYIRHNLVDYDESLYSLKGKVGKYDAYEEYKEVVLEKIAKTYPKYADECQKQIKQIKEGW